MVAIVTLITGCSTGMGFSTAVHLAKASSREFKVYATMRNLSKKDNLETAAGDTLNKRLFIRELDVTKKETITSVVDEIMRENGRIDVVFNNAGFSRFDASMFQEITPESLALDKDMMDTNFWGPMQVLQAVLPIMKKQRAGRIINNSSVAGVAGSPFLGMYSASKFALEGFSESVAPVLRKAYNIRIILIEPGPVYTQPHTTIMQESGFKPEYICSSWDNVSQKLFIDFWNKEFYPEIKIAQQPEEIAELVERVILTENPHLRYQTSALQTEKVAAKMVDPTGDTGLKERQTFK
ncbi:retinol dehydrogenase 8-like [Asterias rubens]|uniref:retinol dehydrogenase 8-like n=1 Tax=Asterias rubens TaxID=7604 RepID=UPI001455C93F|nr:retinol dehydrogenase 8-like [Asterias rubens]